MHERLTRTVSSSRGGLEEATGRDAEKDPASTAPRIIHVPLAQFPPACR